MKILILCAFEAELQHFIASLPQLKEATYGKRRCLSTEINEHAVYVSFSGIGTTNAAKTTTALCAALEPDCIIVCGSAGGLKAGQKTGDLLISERVLDIDLFNLRDILSGTPYEACLTDPHTKKPLAREFSPPAAFLAFCAASQLPNIAQGIIATSNAFPAPKETFELIKKLDCAGIEMESAAVFSAAADYKIPVITVRAISNSIDAAGNDLGTAENAIAICSQRLNDFLHELLGRIEQLSPETARLEA